MIAEEIKEGLNARQDVEYRDFQSNLIPNVGIDYFVGVRTPELRKYAKELGKRDDVSEFLDQLPHQLFDENQLHAFIISDMKDYGKCMERLNQFLPYVNNWATCDQMSPKIFKKHKKELLQEIYTWIKSDETYTIRFAIKMLMEHFLDEDFDIKYAKMVAKVRSEEYYVNMMIAWYFATALAKQYHSILPFITEKKLEKWTHNKTIQKAVESFRITPEQKTYLRTLKIK
ncbi:3-methyladenine DNA glycosylase AlkD [Pseudobutyrivibrio sp. NOR37]|uniref:DNA alkylation repair protein n=1 Tax=Pseudobutyrivibrio xylanivorans TaxID=185007 RepID=A0A6M0LEI9_PSEXY|nr:MULTISPECIES: DNA alkylation repair protein [Pseudobutyrivibrio]NEX00540.1 DNA alkylation repair protein [Pseudobutyrivibrio xylanivorans]SFR60757.1 3-methyladenine DNA glycosylase AlkD [Pseudobutyrivibrio sp. NOR37]